MVATAALRNETYNIGKTDRTLTRVYRIICDNSENYAQAALATGLPTMASKLDGDVGLQVVGITLEREERSKPATPVYIAKVEYSNVGWGGFQYSENPLNQPPVTSVSFQQFSVNMQQDINGAVILNSAGEVFDPGVSVELNDIQITVQRNQPSFDLAQAIAYKDAVNSGEFSVVDIAGTIPAGLAKLQSITGSVQWLNDFKYWQVTVVLMVRKAVVTGNGVVSTDSPWDKIIMDRGMYKISNGTRVAIKDSEGVPLSSPAALDLAGNVLPVGQAAKFLVKKVYPRMDFTLLDLIV